MNTCDTCKHWGESKRGTHRYGENRPCEHIVREGGIPYDASVSPIYDNDFLADLFTGPKFGCLHYGPKL